MVENLADEVARLRRHVALNSDRIDRQTRAVEIGLVRVAQVQEQLDRAERRCRDLETSCKDLERRYRRLARQRGA